MSGLQVTARLKIHDGNLEEFKEVFGAPSAELMESTAEFAPRVYAAFQSI